jgi:WD40 repeat protein
LQTDKIIFTTDEICPCILSNNGRVLIYATANYEIVVRDLVKEQELCKLTGHKAPIAYLTLSEDYEFIASYSTDRQIKIWGIPDYSLGQHN